ncbi:putative transcription factor WRKY family [Helianthus annuus]|nr:putative transcription factor WRKY family [Helianthus annuus]
MGDLCFLPDLKTLKLYLPTAKALQQFLRLERYKVPIYSSLWNYRFMTGHCEELPFSVQLDTEENFLKLEKCVKYMNGEGNTDEIAELIRDARALYLRRHWTVEKLSVFDIRKLKYCLLMECNEMQTLVDQEDFYRDKNKSTSHNEDVKILGSLQYLSINFMKKLQRISKGRIGITSLSCLTILALHTCPELTSIFTECLLDNLQSLTEIIVEDCPKVNCLVNLEEGAPRSNGPFLPNLRRISLIDLPELVSVSGGVCIAPRLNTLLVFSCMKLDYLSDMEIPRDTMAIKGEIEWWDALKYGKSTWESAFVQLKRDGSLMDQLAEETNSLQHFLELQIVPSVPGQVHQNSSTDTKEDMEYVDWLQIDHNADLSDETRKSSNQEPSDDGYIGRKHIQNKSHDSSFSRKHGRFRIAKAEHKMEVSKRIIVAEDLNDGYSWRKYGQKEILGSKYPRYINNFFLAAMEGK